MLTWNTVGTHFVDELHQFQQRIKFHRFCEDDVGTSVCMRGVCRRVGQSVCQRVGQRVCERVYERVYERVGQRGGGGQRACELVCQWVYERVYEWMCRAGV